MPDWLREGLNGSAELVEVPSPTLDPWTLVFGYFRIKPRLILS
jgi:hypothetical protein